MAAGAGGQGDMGGVPVQRYTCDVPTFEVEMRAFPADMLQKAATGLLAVVSAAPKRGIKFSLHYDGTPRRHSKLMTWLGFESDAFSAELALHLAAEQLSKSGLIRRTELDTVLFNSMPDYVMTLTDEGRRFMRRQQFFICHTVFFESESREQIRFTLMSG
jgi:hypothetical protein